MLGWTCSHLTKSGGTFRLNCCSLIHPRAPSIAAEDDERIAMPCEEDVGIRDVKQNLQLSTDVKLICDPI